MTEPYEIGSVIGTETVSSVPPGTSILLVGPPMIGKYRLAMDLLIAGHNRGEGSIVVTTEHQASRIRHEFNERAVNFDNSLLGIVECRSGNEGRSHQVDELTEYVQSPGNLTDIGIGTISCMDAFEERGINRARLVFTSLSTTLTYTDRESVFKFCHVLNARLDNDGYLGVFTIDTGVHDDQTLNTMKRAFDGLIELRESDGGGRELRVAGIVDAPTPWLTV